MPKVRAFLAIPLSEQVRKEARRIRDILAKRLPGIRWIAPETLHLTLKFFGEVEEESLEKIGEVVLSVGCLHPPFQVEIVGVGAFPTPSRPRVFWLGVRGESLLSFHAALEKGLTTIGIPPDDRPFSPHLTLGRSRNRQGSARAALAPFREESCGIFRVDQIILFESRLQPSGAVHLPRKTVFLGR